MDVMTRLIEGEYAFASENPGIRATLRQLSHAYSGALASRDEELARRVKGEALHLKVSQDISVN
jgi:hypothetical protein